LGFAVACALEIQCQCRGTGYVDQRMKVVIPWVSMAVFSIPGAIFGVGTSAGWVAGLSLGIKIGAFHGAMLSLGSLFMPKAEKWSLILPAIFMGIGTLVGAIIGFFLNDVQAGAAIGGLAGSLSACFLIIFVGMCSIWEFSNQEWHGSWSLPIVYCIANFIIAVIVDIFSLSGGWAVIGGLVALLMFIVYDFIMYT
jgi:hypothetical protein